MLLLHLETLSLLIFNHDILYPKIGQVVGPMGTSAVPQDPLRPYSRSHTASLKQRLPMQSVPSIGKEQQWFRR